MELMILDDSFNSVFIPEIFESLIWTERYNKYGDFELYTLANESNLQNLRTDYYVVSGDSEKTMIIESVEIKSDVEDGDHLIITGISLESLLSRRVLWSTTTINGNLQNGIETLINQNIINPSIEDRKISNFIFSQNSDERITSLTLNATFKSGENLYDIISTICELNGLGFKVFLSDDNNFVFQLYIGEDRTYDQFVNPYVVFSKEFDNLKNSNYLESKSAYKNVALVVNESTSLVIGNVGGVLRRETFVDAGSETNLQQKGDELLNASSIIDSLDGEVEPYSVFNFGVDFFIGDLVQLENKYGITSISRVTEVVRSQTTSSTSVYPTFTKIST